MSDVDVIDAIAPILLGFVFLTAGVAGLASLLGYALIAKSILVLILSCLFVGAALFGAAFLVVWGYELGKT